MRKNYTKKSIAGVIAAILLCAMTLSLLTTAVGAAFPKPVDSIADQAGQLSESTIRQIKKTNETLKEQTDCAIAVCTVLTTGETPIGDYAKQLFLDWKLGEGVLILIAAEDANYYLLQSSGVDKVLSNEVLVDIRDEYLEENFSAGNVDRGVLQCVTKIAQNLIKIKADDTAAADTADKAKEPAEKKNSVGSFIVGFFKAILYIVLILAVLFIAFFILAMFNDDAAALLQKYVFQRGNQQKMPEQYYDERLYGDGQRSRSINRGQNPNQRRPQNAQNPARRSPNGSYGSYAQNPNAGQRMAGAQAPNGYLQQSQAPQNGYAQQYAQQQYTQQIPMNRAPQQNAQRTVNPYYAQQAQQAQRPVRSRAPQNGYNPNTGYSRNYVPQAPAAQTAPTAAQYDSSDATRAYTIPGRGQNR